MRWLRPNADPRDLERVEAEVADVARSLEASMADVPASPRMAEIRAALLEEVESIHHPALALRALALAAVVLLAVAVAVGAPVVGSYLETIVDRSTPAPLQPELDANADETTHVKALRGADREGRAGEGRAGDEAPASPAPAAVSEATASPPAAAPGAAAAAASVTLQPALSVSPTPTAEPMPTTIAVPGPPIPIPTPPIVPAP